ncbi:hypothetical protein PaeBR_11075 [Paenibacillus sp. BR2-3]|uniref:hypothetical protein n=1 Tax=Paenibacillus sp. BR2-3 TaxID=3048494 RepID=UPI0039776908
MGFLSERSANGTLLHRCDLQILFIFLSGKNPETAYAFEESFPSESFWATAAAFPQSFRPLRCFQREPFLNLSKNRESTPESVLDKMLHAGIRGFEPLGGLHSPDMNETVKRRCSNSVFGALKQTYQ